MVRRVVYPGLPSHPQHELAKRQQHGFGSMITFYCQGGRTEAAVILQNVSIRISSVFCFRFSFSHTIVTFTIIIIIIKCKLHVFALAESLGAVESLAESPSLMTHASVPDEERAKLGIDDTLIRLSVGVESCADLLDDLRQALDAAAHLDKTSPTAQSA